MKLQVILLAVTLVLLCGCHDRASEREHVSERDPWDDSFTVRDSNDWGDAASRVINHVIASDP